MKKTASRSFACKEDAWKAAQKQCSGKLKYHDSNFRIIESEKQLKGKTTKVYTIELKFTQSEDLVKEEIIRQSCFILALTGSGPFKGSMTLQRYNGQFKVENSFRWIKAVKHIAPIFLKKNERIAALSLAYIVALMARSLIQMKVREALAVQGKTTPSNYNRGRSDKPSAEVIFNFMRGLKTMRIKLESGEEKRLLFNLTTEKVAVFEYLGLSFLDQSGLIYEVREPRRGEGGFKQGPSIIERKGKRQTRKRNVYRNHD